MGLGRASVRGRRRVPRPAANRTARVGTEAEFGLGKWNMAEKGWGKKDGKESGKVAKFCGAGERRKGGEQGFRHDAAKSRIRRRGAIEMEEGGKRGDKRDVGGGEFGIVGGWGKG